MGRRRARREMVALPGTEQVDDPDEQLLVVDAAVATHATKAQKETRRAARAERKLARAEQKAVTKAAKAGAAVADDRAEPDGTSGKKDRKGKKDKGKGAKATQDTKDGGELTGATVKRYIGIARIVIPVLAPIAYQAAGAARAQWDSRRARQLGVAPDELSEFTGRGAGLYARIHHLALSTRDLRARHGEDAETRAFVDDADARLTDLESAVRAAEQMPASRRRSAHAAVAAEIERLETRVLTLWGIGRGTPGSNGTTTS